MAESRGISCRAAGDLRRQGVTPPRGSGMLAKMKAKAEEAAAAAQAAALRAQEVGAVL